MGTRLAIRAGLIADEAGVVVVVGCRVVVVGGCGYDGAWILPSLVNEDSQSFRPIAFGSILRELGLKRVNRHCLTPCSKHV